MYKRLGDMIETNISSYSASDGYSYVNYLDTGNITGNVISQIQKIDLRLETLPSRARRKVHKGDVIFSMVRPNQRHYGYMSAIPPNFLVSTGFCVITPKYGLTDGRFIYFLLAQDWVIQKLQSIGEQSTSAYPAIKPSDIENLELEIPDYMNQKRIASILSALDDKIENNAAINRNLEEQAKAIFKSWFVDFEPFQDGEFIDSELGKIPKGWKTGLLADLGKIVGGSTPSKSQSSYYTSPGKGIAWITPKDLSVNKNKFIFHGEMDITDSGFANSSTSILPQGTVLFSSRAPIGYIAIAGKDVTTNQGFKSVVPNSNVGTAYLYYLLHNLLPTIEGMASGSTFKEISGSGMKKVPVIIPSDSILRSFKTVCEPFFKKQMQNERETSILTTLRDTLLPKLMSGEIDVSKGERMEALA